MKEFIYFMTAKMTYYRWLRYYILGADEDNTLKANDVLKILKEKVAFLSGKLIS